MENINRKGNHIVQKRDLLGRKYLEKIYSNLKVVEAFRQVKRVIPWETPVTLFCI